MKQVETKKHCLTKFLYLWSQDVRTRARSSHSASGWEQSFSWLSGSLALLWHHLPTKTIIKQRDNDNSDNKQSKHEQNYINVLTMIMTMIIAIITINPMTITVENDRANLTIKASTVYKVNLEMYDCLLRTSQSKPQANAIILSIRRQRQGNRKQGDFKYYMDQNPQSNIELHFKKSFFRKQRKNFKV